MAVKANIDPANADRDRSNTVEQREGDSQKVLTSTSAHPAYVHHYATTKHHYTTAKRHTPYRKRHVTHTRTITHRHLAHYKKIKRVNKNGEYKVKYKT